MYYRSVVLAFLLFALADAAQAGQPLIVIYNYTAPQPSLVLASIDPANHQTFDTSPPSSVEVMFSQTIVPEKSDLKVFDQYNNLITTAKTMPKDTRMAVSLPAHLLAEVYRVEWSATCACQGNATISGTSYFTVY